MSGTINEKIKKAKHLLFEDEKCVSLEYEKRLGQINELSLCIMESLDKKDGRFEKIKEVLYGDTEQFGFHKEILPENKQCFKFRASEKAFFTLR